MFVKDARVPPTNNLAERTLRPLVIMRKICFGNRSRDGGQRLAKIMSVKDTARRHGHNPLRVFYRLFTQPPDKVMQFIYKKNVRKEIDSLSSRFKYRRLMCGRFNRSRAGFKVQAFKNSNRLLRSLLREIKMHTDLRRATKKQKSFSRSPN